MFITYLKIIVYFVEFKAIRFLAHIAFLPINKLPAYNKDQKSIINSASKNLLDDWSRSSVSFSLLDLRPLDHLKRLFYTLKDLPTFLKRKSYKESSDISSSIALDSYPEYLKRNYHYQSDGYFSERSALIYDHQIELLFLGTAHLMRKVSYLSAKDFLNTEEIEVLEFGAGNGTSAYQFKKCFPLSVVDLLDPSHAYLKFAKEQYPDSFRHLFIKELESFTGEKSKYDLVFSCFTMHEIPVDYWDACLKNIYESLRPEGLLLIIDSQQDHDGDDIHFALDDFQDDYYEPYFDKYRITPLESYIEDRGFSLLSKKEVLLSKALVFKRNS